jgi:hypothetical protein
VVVPVICLPLYLFVPGLRQRPWTALRIAVAIVAIAGLSVHYFSQLSDRRVALRKFRRQSLYLLLPFLVPLLAILQQREARTITSANE